MVGFYNEKIVLTKFNIFLSMQCSGRVRGSYGRPIDNDVLHFWHICLISEAKQ